MCKDANQVYQLNAEDKEMILEHKKFYQDLNKYGFYILDNSFGSGNIKDYELTIYSGVYKVLEILDTLEVMTENSLVNSSFIIVRALLEASVQLAYILKDPATEEKKAIILQMFDIKRTVINEEEYYDRMSQTECYKDFVKYIKDKCFGNWYSYSEEKRTSLSDLFDIVEWSELHNCLYKPLCKEVHVITHMERNIVPSFDNQFLFKPFRHFENNVELMDCVLMTIVPLYSCFFNRYDTLSELKDEWDKYAEKVRKYIHFNNSINNLMGKGII